jgi:hypothetical protein
MRCFFFNLFLSYSLIAYIEKNKNVERRKDGKITSGRAGCSDANHRWETHHVCTTTPHGLGIGHNP